VNVRLVATLPSLAAALVLAPVAAAPASSAPPERGLFVPGVSLGGVELGMTKREVVRVWGARHGVCRSCAREIWYFNLRPFEPEGAGAVFRRGRVAHVFTLWRPEGWRTVDGLALGADEEEIGAGLAVLHERPCRGYTAVLASGPSAVSAFYLYRGRVWGFGLIPPGGNPCL
jgi:hypothetical protein